MAWGRARTVPGAEAEGAGRPSLSLRFLWLLLPPEVPRAGQSPRLHFSALFCQLQGRSPCGV